MVKIINPLGWVVQYGVQYGVWLSFFVYYSLNCSLIINKLEFVGVNCGL